MKPAKKLGLCVLAATLLWLLDSAVFSAVYHTPFFPALWGSVSTLRLVFRLLVVCAVLFYGVISFVGREVRLHERTKMNKADRGALFGNAESPNRSQRILYYAIRLATVLKMRPKEKHDLRLLCYCYDIGMVGVPTEVLEKEAPLSREDQTLHDVHLDLGAAIVAQIPQLRRAASLIACHEEHYNGGGPKAMYGRSIPLACRIFMLASMFDHYTQIHDGSPALSEAAALEEMALYRGTVLDPDVYDAFCHMMRDKKLRARVAELVYSAR